MRTPAIPGRRHRYLRRPQISASVEFLRRNVISDVEVEVVKVALTSFVIPIEPKRQQEVASKQHSIDQAVSAAFTPSTAQKKLYFAPQCCLLSSAG